VQFPIHIELRRSRLLSFFLLLFHVLAGGCVVLLPWAWGLRFFLLALIGISAWRALRSSEIVGLRLAEGGEFAYLLANGDRVASVILPDSTVFNWLVVLRLREGDESKSNSLTLLPDSMSGGQFRVLRSWLRWRATYSERVGKPV